MVKGLSSLFKLKNLQHAMVSHYRMARPLCTKRSVEHRAGVIIRLVQHNLQSVRKPFQYDDDQCIVYIHLTLYDDDLCIVYIHFTLYDDDQCIV